MLGLQYFSFMEARIESMGQPHSAADDFGEKAMALIAEGLGLHSPQLAKRELI